MKVDQTIGLTFRSAAVPHQKRSLKFSYPGVLVLLLVSWLLHGCGGPTTTPAVLTLPGDPAPLCAVVSKQNIDGWFVSDSVSLNGGVENPSSISSPAPNCAFYAWAEQMFLWLTSPAPTIYGRGLHVFDSGIFFDVSAPDRFGNRTFIRHTPGLIRFMGLRAAQVGPDNLPVIIAKSGQMIEIAPPRLAPDGKQLILNGKAQEIEIDHAEIGREGKPIFFDKNGNIIQNARPIIPAETNKLRLGKPVPKVAQFVINRFPIFLNGSGQVVDVEEGQAGGGGVLETQGGSLVYYATFVNDVYAYYVTGVKDGAIPAPGGDINQAQFPTSLSTLAPATAFASAHGVAFRDSVSLAVEVKTSWVEASTIPDSQDYILETATIPTYDTSGHNKWIPNGQKTVIMALVGLHAVGSVIGHPEMVWASFEHQSNAPDAGYGYMSTTGPKSVSRNTNGNWLFCANGASGPFNQLHMFAVGDTIESVSPFTISPSNTIRWKAWGGGFDVAPNPIDRSTDSSNSEIISINNNVRGLLASGDIRGNYILTGATWTTGDPPSGSFPSGDEVGTSKLTNTTMETYQQGSDRTFSTGTNCFSCHVTNTVNVSHMFQFVKPLF